MYKVTKQNTQHPQGFTSQSFNRDFLCRVDGTIGNLTLHTAVGFATMIDILGDRAEKTLNRLNGYKGEKLAVKPFHGLTITFYYR